MPVAVVTAAILIFWLVELTSWAVLRLLRRTHQGPPGPQLTTQRVRPSRSRNSAPGAEFREHHPVVALGPRDARHRGFHRPGIARPRRLRHRIGCGKGRDRGPADRTG